MNKSYIKRQITLGKLGLPMSEDVKEYYNYFHQLIGNINHLEELIHDDYPNSIFWRKNGKVILEYYIKNEYFYVKHDIIWSKFEKKYRLNYNNISDLLSVLLEEAFRLRTTTASIRYWQTIHRLEEAFKLRATKK